MKSQSLRRDANAPVDTGDLAGPAEQPDDSGSKEKLIVTMSAAVLLDRRWTQGRGGRNFQASRHHLEKTTGARSDHTTIPTAIGSAKGYPDQ